VTKLSGAEIERYARQIILRGVGGPGQQKLKAARVVVVGAGGLGSPALQYLAAAGVGEIAVIDDDVVSLSNLHRQILHGTPDLDRLKVDSAADALRRLNPEVKIETKATRVEESNAREIVRGYDVALDGSDNFATRYALSDACFFERVTLVTAALGQYDATLTTLKPHLHGADGRPNPTYRCLFPEAPPPGSIPTCAEAGVLGALAGMVGAMMAMETIREIVGGFEDGDAGLVGKLLMIDARALRFETLTYGWDEDNPLNGRIVRE
jgi:molybdopterin-synthase adenylyltransferase